LRGTRAGPGLHYHRVSKRHACIAFAFKRGATVLPHIVECKCAPLKGSFEGLVRRACSKGLLATLFVGDSARPAARRILKYLENECKDELPSLHSLLRVYLNSLCVALCCPSHRERARERERERERVCVCTYPHGFVRVTSR